MKTLLELHFPLDSGLFTTVRLAVSGVCAYRGFGLDEGEDCKVCVTESLLLLKHSGYASACVKLFEADGLGVEVQGEGARKEQNGEAEDDISLALLAALLGDVKEDREDGRLKGLSFVYGKQA